MTVNFDDPDFLNQQYLQKLIERFPDSERHKYVLDNVIWKQDIEPALLDFAKRVELGAFSNLTMMFSFMRLLFEIVYVLGYRQGQAQRKINWVVKED